MENITEKCISFLQFRIKKEEESHRLYKSMSIWLNWKGYSGAAKLWNKYAEEELNHANWAYTYLLSLDVKPEVDSLERPYNEFTTLSMIIQLSYNHEKKITLQCQQLAKEALLEGDFMLLELAQKYLKEQQEELDKTNYWINRIEIFGESKEALFLLDNEMGNN